ncbi:MAG: hypothetical protein AAGF35_12845 [Pseudomonadota bacterium]
MIFSRLTLLPCSFERAVTEVKSTRLLHYIAHPLVKFVPHDPPTLPECWGEETYWCKLKYFGAVPAGLQAIVISFPKSEEDSFILCDRGHSRLMPVWNHTITLIATDNGVRYEDNVELSAGVLTPIVGFFAQLFFAHRQRRWHKLIESDFRYDA